MFLISYLFSGSWSASSLYARINISTNDTNIVKQYEKLNNNMIDGDEKETKMQANNYAFES